MGECAERCELCGAPAAVHCAADAAFLCAGCDARVHGANFLASRHSRSRLVVACAPGCEAATAAEEEDEGYASAASSCVSTATESASTTGRRGRRSAGSPRQARGAEVVIEGWAKRMGLPAQEARRRAAATGRTLRACGPDVAAARVPLRVAMAAALWREVAAGSGAGAARGCDALRRLEACAHVPARLVLTVASSMMARERARRRAAADAVEGWDECSYVGPKSNPVRS